jgi:alkylation response protein AidB-like acyl-CoA dehydrogenase
MHKLIDDQTLDFILHDCVQAERLLTLPRFQHVSPETMRMSLDVARRLGREVLFPTLRLMDTEPCEFKGGKIHTHPTMGKIYAQMADAGFITLHVGEEHGGQQLPMTLSIAMEMYTNAGNVGACCFFGLTTGAAGLIESFGSKELQDTYMKPMYEGRWTGTMCLTEPQAGSSLADVRTKAVPHKDGGYSMRGSKVFISGGDNTFSENVVHLVLGRVEGAPAGIKGVSLFVVPKKRVEAGKLVDNDVKPSGLFHKMGWKGLPSIALEFGEDDGCRGYLVGEANHGLKYMFQMMNGARLAVGLSAVGTASVAYLSALDYAKNRPQGRASNNRDPNSPQIPIIRHNDVKRMLLAQKAIVEGGMALLLRAGMYFDLAQSATDAEMKGRAQKLLDVLTPIAKTFPSEKGFEANALSVQIHGGYGYTAEYLPELLLREQKLNTLHEGTTGVQSLDLLGRKIFGDFGQGLAALSEEIDQAVAKAPASLAHLAKSLAEAKQLWSEGLAPLAERAQGGDIDAALQTSAWHLELAGIVVIGWMWLDMATHAAARKPDAFAAGKLAAAEYWFEAEISRVPAMAKLIAAPKVSYVGLADDAF